MLSKTSKLLSASLRLSKLANFQNLTALQASCLSFNHFNSGFQTTKSFFATNTKLYSTKDQSDLSENEEELLQEKGKTLNKSAEANKLSNFNISPATREVLESIGITSLFPIQAATYDSILAGKDIIARDHTGSGKTLSYALPICEKFRNEGLFKKKSGQAPLALVVLPTRELALQVNNVFNSIKQSEGDFRVLSVYGGADARPQIDSLRRGVEVLVGTPGRLIDLIERGEIDLSKLKTIVLDEADLMLDMGFQEDIEKIYEKIQDSIGEKSIQTMLHSATMPSWVHNVAKKYLRGDDMVRVDLLQNKEIKMPTTVSHYAINCPYAKRIETLADIVLCYGGQHARTIIFTDSKKEANNILLEANIRQECQVLHGDIPQEQREVTFKAFREGKFKCLIATNVAARGLDIPEVDLIIQLDPPNDVETYIHRAGRTARAGKSGVCVTLYSSKTLENLEQIEKKAKFKFQKVGAPQPDEIIKASSRDIATSIKNVSHDVTFLFKDISQELIQELGAEEALSRALALVTGTTEKFKQRSLITSHEGFVTYEVNTENETTYRGVMDGLRSTFPENLFSSLKEIKMFKNRMGAAFDVPEKYEKEFSALIQEISREGFEIKKSETLAELEDRGFMTRDFGSRNYGDRRGERSDRFERSDRSDRYGGKFERSERSSGKFDRNDRSGGRFDRNDRSERGSFGNTDDLQVFVGSLDQSVNEQDLEELFRQAKLKVRRVKIMRGKIIL